MYRSIFLIIQIYYLFIMEETIRYRYGIWKKFNKQECLKLIKTINQDLFASLQTIDFCYRLMTKNCISGQSQIIIYIKHISFKIQFLAQQLLQTINLFYLPFKAKNKFAFGIIILGKSQLIVNKKFFNLKLRSPIVYKILENNLNHNLKQK